MALKITTQIGTDQGITNEAYVRISNYNISKNGNAVFQLQLFQNEEASKTVENFNHFHHTPSLAKNIIIGDTFTVELKKEVEVIEKVLKPIVKEVDVTETVTIMGADGKPKKESVTRKENRRVEEIVEETVLKVIPDLSVLSKVSLFVFAYSRLKAKLQESFGNDNVVDC